MPSAVRNWRGRSAATRSRAGSWSHAARRRAMVTSAAPEVGVQVPRRVRHLRQLGRRLYSSSCALGRGNSNSKARRSNWGHALTGLADGLRGRASYGPPLPRSLVRRRKNITSPSAPALVPGSSHPTLGCVGPSTPSTVEGDACDHPLRASSRRVRAGDCRCRTARHSALLPLHRPRCRSATGDGGCLRPYQPDTVCRLPFPNDYFTVCPYPASPTGKRVNSRPPRCPPTCTTPQSTRPNGTDRTGSSPGSPIRWRARLDAAATGIAPVTDIAAGWRRTRRSSCSTPSPAKARRTWRSWTRTPPHPPAVAARPAGGRAGGGVRTSSPCGARAPARAADPRARGVPVVRRRRRPRPPGPRHPADQAVLDRLPRSGVERTASTWPGPPRWPAGGPTRRLLRSATRVRRPRHGGAGVHRHPGDRPHPPQQDARIAAAGDRHSASPSAGGSQRTRTSAALRTGRWRRSKTHDVLPAHAVRRDAAGGIPLRHPRQRSAADPAPSSLYGHGLLGSRDEVDAGNVPTMRRARRRRSAPPTGSGCPRTTSATRRRSSATQRVPGGGRPAPAGHPELPVPRPADDAPGRLRRDPAFQDADGQP